MRACLCRGGVSGKSGAAEIEDEGTTMDYKKSGNPKPNKNTPPHQEHNQKGGKANPYGATPAKQDLLERMKAAAEAKKKS